MTHIQTYTQTWRLYDRPGPEGRLRENTYSLSELLKGNLVLSL